MQRTIDFGKLDFNNTGRKANKVTATVELRENSKGLPVLAIRATVYAPNGIGTMYSGQCLQEVMKRVSLCDTSRFDVEGFTEVYNLWRTYHLNDMHAGTPEQEEALKNCKSHDYTERCEYLQAHGLYEVEHDGKPYKYGYSWLYEEIPANVLNRIKEIING